MWTKCKFWPFAIHIKHPPQYFNWKQCDIMKRLTWKHSKCLLNSDIKRSNPVHTLLMMSTLYSQASIWTQYTKWLSVFFITVCYGKIFAHCVHILGSSGCQELIKCKTVTWMQCKSLWIKASAKCINVNVNVNLLSCTKYASSKRCILNLAFKYHRVTTPLLNTNLVKITGGQRRKALFCPPGGQSCKGVTWILILYNTIHIIPYNRGVKLSSWRAAALQSLVPTLLQHTNHLVFK